MLHRIIRGIAPVAAFAAAFALGACDGEISINGEKGVPLADLDLAGKTPTSIVAAGPDSIVVTEGAALKIDVSGDPDAVAAVRFTLDDETLGVMRAKDSRNVDGKARIAVTLPALETVTLAGSGTFEAAKLSGKAEVTVAGSGTATTATVDAPSLEVTIAGSGTYRAGGKTDKLDLTVAGSGEADMAGLSAGNADVTIAGSGKAAFASDGKVDASIMGSGEVTVTGNAQCTVSAMGSGKLNCQGGSTTTKAGSKGKAPTPPQPPATPGTPAPPAAPAAPDAPEPSE